MDRASLDEATINDTLGMLQKYHDDVQRVQGVWACDPAKRAHSTH
jgi:hypothetical protein